MKSLIEILDFEKVENLVCPIVYDFKKVIYLFDAQHYNKGKAQAILKFLQNRKVEVFFYQVKDYDFSIFDEDDEYYFNLSNGNRSMLVELSHYCLEKNKNCFYINFRKHQFKSIKGCENFKGDLRMFKLSIKQIIELQGSLIKHHNHFTPNFNDEDEIMQIKKIIEIMNQDNYIWTYFIKILSKEMKSTEKTAYIDDKLIDPYLKNRVTNLLIKLSKLSILKYTSTDTKIVVEFLDEEIKQLLRSSGAWLEYQSFIELKESNYFDDVAISTMIDLNGQQFHRNEPTCEIDIIVIKNAIPYFVSCKMNKLESLDIYEIKTLAQKLGGTYAQACIITGASSANKDQAMYLKAVELGVHIINQNDIINHKIVEKIADIII